MSECTECGANDWGYFHCTYKDGTYLIEACLQCTAVKPEGLIEPLMEAIRDEVGLNMEVTLETDSEKIARIDRNLQELIDAFQRAADEEGAE